MCFNKEDYFALDESYVGKQILPEDGWVENDDRDQFTEFSGFVGSNYNKADGITGLKEGRFFRKRSYVDSYNKFKVEMTYEEVLKMKKIESEPPYGWRFMREDEVFSKDDIFVCGDLRPEIVSVASGAVLSNWKKQTGSRCKGLRKISTIHHIATVDGVVIELTPEQVKKINDAKSNKQKEDEKYLVKVGDVIVHYIPGNIFVRHGDISGSLENPRMSLVRARSNFDTRILNKDYDYSKPLSGQFSLYDCNGDFILPKGYEIVKQGRFLKGDFLIAKEQSKVYPDTLYPCYGGTQETVEGLSDCLLIRKKCEPSTVKIIFHSVELEVSPEKAQEIQKAIESESSHILKPGEYYIGHSGSGSFYCLQHLGKKDYYLRNFQGIKATDEDEKYFIKLKKRWENRLCKGNE